MNKIDIRTLDSMLQLEENYILNIQSLNRAYCNQIKPEMRSKLATWMLEVCEEQQCTDEIYSLSMNLFDRLICSMNRVEVYHLQLLGVVCLFLSSKLKSNQVSKHLDAFKLIEYTDNSITLEDLLDWELLCLDKMRWDIAAIVPNDFVDIFLDELQSANELDFNILKKHCYAFTAMCSTDYRFAQYPASMIASACILAAVQGLNNFDSVVICSQLEQLANVDQECLLTLKEQVDELFKQTTNPNTNDSVDELNDLLETNRLLNDIQFEDDYEFNVDYNLEELNSYEVTRQVLNNLENEQQTPINKTLSKSAKKKKQTKKSKRLTEATDSAQKKKSIISPNKRNFSRSSSRRSSSGVSSCATSNASDNLYLCNSLSSSSLASLLSTASSSTTTASSKYLMSMMFVTPPQAASLPMPVFNTQDSNEINNTRRVSTRRKCSNQFVIV